MASAEYQRNWRKKNPDKVRKHNKTQRINHPKEIAEGKLAWARKNPSKVKAAYRKYKYGITQDQFNSMLLLQDGKCAICFKEFGESTPQIDHNHITEKTRELLCKFCNIALSLVEDSIRLASAIQYLEKHKETNVVKNRKANIDG